jgi:formiminotetrahydrofolate cyclodeaminase
LTQFCDATSADVAVPGGGSVSALSASLGASLVEMVGNMTARKAQKNGVELDTEIAEGTKKAAESRTRLQQLIDEDAQSFDCVMAAFTLPKNTDEEKETRRKSIQQAYMGAIKPPVEVVKISYGLLKYAVAMIKKGDPNALSDAAVGLRMLHAGLFSAAYNVRINLSSLQDENEVTKLAVQMEKIEQSADCILHEVLDNLTI